MNNGIYKGKLLLANHMSEFSANFPSMELGSVANAIFYSHKYQQLPLIPVDEFLAQHPEHADADENALMIARIDHEHQERLKLEEQRQGLLKKKQGLIADNKKRKDDLANLDKDLEKFIDVSLDLVVAIF